MARAIAGSANRRASRAASVMSRRRARSLRVRRRRIESSSLSSIHDTRVDARRGGRVPSRAPYRRLRTRASENASPGKEIVTDFRDFDLAALFDALDAQRQARGLSWAEVMREVNRGIATRAVASSTVTRLRTQKVAEADGVLQMLRWLRRAPESFVPGSDGD